MRPTFGRIIRAVASAVRSPARRKPPPTRPERSSQRRRRYPGDFTGSFTPRYAATLNGRADPGEILWTWVPYEDDPTRGKDRPVLAVGEHRGWLLCLMLSSKDHDRDADDEARWGRRWMDVGAGAWDKRRRPSEVRLDRIIRIHPDDVRREGAVLDRKTFDRVIGSL